jgi:GTP-binding protein HflX
MSFDTLDYGLPRGAKAILVSVISPAMLGHRTEFESTNSLRELKELLRTLGIEALGDFTQNKKSIEAATVLGSGKLLEIAQEAKDVCAEFLAFDFELTAGQVRNITKLTGLDVIDRCNIILEIFAQHAQTMEAKIQIEISRLQYLLPRLTSFWTHFGKQKGGIGMKGEGEQQLELDRRIIRERISHHKKKLISINKSRIEQKKKRQNQSVTAALVGYTNAGKSSLLNRMCKVNILEEDKLFATLDATYRVLNPDTKPPMILIDTVGFLSNLPNTLIEGFKTTLESALEADLLLIVVDLSDDNFEQHIKVTQSVLGDLGITDKEIVYVFNKKDKVTNLLEKKVLVKKYEPKFVLSGLDLDDVEELRTFIIDYFLSKQASIDLFIPYDDGAAHSKIEGKTNVEIRKNHEKGIYYRIRVPDFIFGNLGVQSYVLSANDLEIYN